jgi:hypothetical protein
MMNSTKLNSWLTLGANIGVIIGLILLVVEIRQNTSASQAQAAQAIIDSSRNFLVGIAMDEEFARLRAAAESSFSSLSESDAYRFTAYTRGNWLYFQNVWIQWDLGVVDDRIWWTVKEIICEIQSRPGNLKEWEKHRAVMDADFAKIVDSCAENL